jgi:hypothetical protein
VKPEFKACLAMEWNLQNLRPKPAIEACALFEAC